MENNKFTFTIKHEINFNHSTYDESQQKAFTEGAKWAEKRVKDDLYEKIKDKLQDFCFSYLINDIKHESSTFKITNKLMDILDETLSE